MADRLSRRPRRMRQDALRDLVNETTLTVNDLVAPLFVDETARNRRPIPSMPGQERIPPEEIVGKVKEIQDKGIKAVMLFGIPEKKDQRGTEAWAPDGVIQRATRRICDATNITVITDLCLCEYTSHGHCGVLEPSAKSDPKLTVSNDETLALLGKIAISQAEAGSDMVAPSGMMDGMVGEIRRSLDEAGFSHIPIMSYAVKYASAFYGPFRDAADGAPAFGDRKHYQMDLRNAREALVEAKLDIEEGADIVMVKPALAYLDILQLVQMNTKVPIAAYNVSGEYAMVHAAAANGWLDLEETAIEILSAIKRAGGQLIVTYFAEDIASTL